MTQHRYIGKVLHGDKIGRTLGFPTANLSPQSITTPLRHGIYAARVYIKNKEYRGALFYGPRLVIGESQVVLEIHIIDFSKTIYGVELSFVIDAFMHEPRNYSSQQALIPALKTDVAAVRTYYQSLD